MPSGLSTLWFGPATKPSSDIESLSRNLDMTCSGSGLPNGLRWDRVQVQLPLSDNPQSLDRNHDDAGKPDRQQHALQEPCPRMQRSTLVHGKSAKRKEQDEHDDAGRQDIRRESLPLWIGGHPTGEKDESQASSTERKDRTHHVLWGFSRHAVHTDPRKNAGQ